jgi:tRNA-uridine 2-sulfurtransferase
VKVMCAMSGGVDSSVAALLLQRAGHEVVGVTMKLWGGDSDTGCCSVSDVDDARRVAQQLGIDHLVFNFGDDFDEHVVAPYVDAHTRGITPNPCIECNRSVKFARLAERADLLGFDAVATGHHANIGRGPDGRYTLERGSDAAKDQSYVVHMLDQAQLARTMFPVGGMQKADLRALAASIDLRTATKPDSQDVCFITSTGGRTAFLGERIPFRQGTVVDSDGNRLGEVESVELVTVGQRKGIGLPGGGPKRYVLDVDTESAIVTVGADADLLRDRLVVDRMSWIDEAVEGPALVQCSAHGRALAATITAGDADDSIVVRWAEPQRRIAPGQSVVAYDVTDTRVLGGGICR